MPRHARIVIPKLLHHVTQRGNRHENVFHNDSDRAFFLDRLRFYADKAELQLAAHCLMTNHTHLLVIPENEKSLERTFKPLHLVYSQYLNKRFSRSGINWQGRYFSSPLDAQHSWHAFQYVALNPVKAHMVSSIEQYRWSNACSIVLGQNDFTITAEGKWLDMGRAALLRLKRSANIDEFELIHERFESAVERNLPVGDSNFIKELEHRTGRYLRQRTVGRPKRADNRDASGL